MIAKERKERSERRQDEVEYEREQEQYTFKPNLNPRKSSLKHKHFKNINTQSVRGKQKRKIGVSSKFIKEKDDIDSDIRKHIRITYF